MLVLSISKRKIIFHRMKRSSVLLVIIVSNLTTIFLLLCNILLLTVTPKFQYLDPIILESLCFNVLHVYGTVAMTRLSVPSRKRDILPNDYYGINDFSNFCVC